MYTCSPEFKVKKFQCSLFSPFERRPGPYIYKESKSHSLKDVCVMFVKWLPTPSPLP